MFQLVSCCCTSAREDVLMPARSDSHAWPACNTSAAVCLLTGHCWAVCSAAAPAALLHHSACLHLVHAPCHLRAPAPPVLQLSKRGPPPVWHPVQHLPCRLGGGAPGLLVALHPARPHGVPHGGLPALPGPGQAGTAGAAPCLPGSVCPEGRCSVGNLQCCCA